MVPFARPAQLELIAECTQSCALDDGAFTAWRAGRPVRDWTPYYRWVEEWKQHRLRALTRSYGRIALGSAGCYRTPDTLLWWDRMNDVLDALCDENGRAVVKLPQ